MGVLEDKFTAKVLGATLIGFPCLIVSSTLYLTNPSLRNPSLYAILCVMALPVMGAGVYVFSRAKNLKEDDDD
ncbi:MAG TPA: hypothetical protein PLR99_14255 [Polyangiaceae bacterium]|jgi:hypothetical protein|nr:hypothetical protein [Polyangiaceae bacterium]